MDKKQVYGLVLIGLIFTVFTIFTQPSKEDQIKASKEAAKMEGTSAEKKKVKTSVDDSNTQSNETAVELTKKEKSKPASLAIQKGELVRLENEKLIIDFSTKGGKVAAVYLKEFQAYKDFRNKKQKKTPLNLFQDGDAVNEISIPINGRRMKTGDLGFTVKRKTKNSIIFMLNTSEGQTIEYVYTLNENAYDLDYTVNLDGFEGKVVAQNVRLNWNTSFRKTERLLKMQKQVSTVCYMNNQDKADNLSEMSDDGQLAEHKIDWIAFKQSYFSSILKPENSFSKKGTKFRITNIKAGDKRFFTHIKDYSTSMNLGLSSMSHASVKMNWYFGPNDYYVLKSYDSGYDDILNFGWGVFRWINLFFFYPIFSFFTSSGMGIGLAILLLTLVLKLVLMPIQWKQFVSSAKMRILKPEIDELSAKFPNKDDAMKKQVEMMSLYRESGASPLAGCIPALIQMPILITVYKFFPAAFELRQRSFLWAEDLSSYDSIFDFGFTIPIYGDHISLFTLLFCGATLAFTYLNSGNVQQPTQPGMPNMKVMMYMMPFLMIFMFNDYSSGLSYYYFISTFISILLMIAIKQFFVDEEKLKEKMAARKLEKSTVVKKKSKFQERLEQMQKLQQEQKNARKK